jgi:hypothetical protein
MSARVIARPAAQRRIGPVLGEPARVNLSATSGDTTWIQIACCGSFVSQRYGKFEISPDDLRTMLRNFKTVTPKAPTQLPVDYDHLSMDPKAPGDGKAAGWFEDLELRNDDQELWGRVTFTPSAAQAIRAHEYRFISPSFVKNYVHKDGRPIGTTLIAAAITNQPFLEGMQAISLSAISSLHGDVPGAPVDVPLTPAGKQDLVVIGQKVTISPEGAANYGFLDPAVVGTPLVIAESKDKFARLETADGQSLGWFAEQDLAPAPISQEALTNAAADLLAMAIRHQRTHPGMDLRSALHAVSLAEVEAVARYRASGTHDEPRETFALAKPGHASKSLSALAKERAAAKGITLREAAREIAEEQPALADQWRGTRPERYTRR